MQVKYAPLRVVPTRYDSEICTLVSMVPTCYDSEICTLVSTVPTWYDSEICILVSGPHGVDTKTDVSASILHGGTLNSQLVHIDAFPDLHHLQSTHINTCNLQVITVTYSTLYYCTKYYNAIIYRGYITSSNIY